MQVLIVDDDGDDREILGEAFAAIDTRISTIQADGGLEALELLREAPSKPDFVFLDINMPRMNGYQCLQELRSLPGSEQMSIVMYSTTITFGDERFFSSLGIKYLTKKARFAELVSAVKGIIETGHQPVAEVA